MNFWTYAAFFIISLGASIIGAICGIGGGVIVKPTLDVFNVASVSTISFLSGCMVLSMSCYSVIKGMISKEQKVDMKTDTPLALGAVIGGVAGKQLFDIVKSASSNPNRVGAVQAICLGIITVGTLLYTVFKDKIPSKNVKNIAVCVVLGLVLGIMSSFLGIGGGPINLVVLYYFFSMETKKAANSSLYIILFSQPEFEPLALVVMVVGGILGGIIGRSINKKISSKTVSKLFIGLMAIIILICVYNAIRFMA